MNFYYLNKLQDILAVIQSIQNDKTIKSLMVNVADNDRNIVTELIEQLNVLNLPFFGGVFPELIVNNERKQEGVLLIPLEYKVDNFIVQLDDQLAIENQTENICNIIDPNSNTVWIYLDCFSNNKTFFIESLYQNLGYTFSYVGGGAGSLSFEKNPCVFNNTGVYNNTAILAFAETDLSLGIAHGWSPISEKVKVTSASGNNIKTLDWKPAYEVYTSIVEKHTGSKFDKKTFLELVKSYPLGMIKVDGDIIVRDLIDLEGDELLLLDQVNEGEFIQFLYGDINSLLKGTHNAKLLINKREANKNIFCIDCISRALYMDNHFQNEINIMRGNQNLNGILTLGEIANNGKSFLEIYNKTTVLITW